MRSRPFSLTNVAIHPELRGGFAPQTVRGSHGTAAPPRWRRLPAALATATLGRQPACAGMRVNAARRTGHDRRRTPVETMTPIRSAPAPAAAPAPDPALVPAGAVSGRLPGLVAAFSTALPRLPDSALGPLLRTLAARTWGRPTEGLPLPLLLRQTHSPYVLELASSAGALQGAAEAGEAAASPPADGATAGPGAPRLLAVKTADCVPLLAVDVERGAYAALHAGWRGTAAGILPRLLAAWRTAGSSLRAVHLELGPHIRGCCYEVQADCLAHFTPAQLHAAVETRAGRSYLALAAVLRTQALDAGVPASQVHGSAHCTYCQRGPDGSAPYASYRRAGHLGQPFVGTNVGLIGMLAP